MKRFPILVLASAVAAALAAPLTLAQTSGGDAPRGTDRNAAGGTGGPSSPGGTVPSNQPATPAERMGDRSTGTPGTAGARPSERSPTDGRTGGTGPNSGSTSSTQPSTSGDRMGSPNMGTSGDRASDRSPTDGRSGGTGIPSSTSGAVPSTNPQMGQSSAAGGEGHGASTVRSVQQSLQDKGFDVGPIDGVMGPRTQAALREFQQRQGIQGTGQLNQETMSALDVRARSGG